MKQREGEREREAGVLDQKTTIQGTLSLAAETFFPFASSPQTERAQMKKKLR